MCCGQSTQVIAVGIAAIVRVSVGCSMALTHGDAKLSPG